MELAVPVSKLPLCNAAATQGVKTFDHYKDPETGKEGKTNVSVTVGAYRGNKLVSILCHQHTILTWFVQYPAQSVDTACLSHVHAVCYG